MEVYTKAFDELEENFRRESNGRLFRLAKKAYENGGGRGAITMLYTNASDVFCATGTAPAQYVPLEIVKIEDGDDVADACQEYNPNKEFVVSVSIGQDNDITKPVLRKTFTIPYIGEKGEQWLDTLTISIDQMESRLNGKKSYKCDWCGQRRKLQNLIRDPVVRKLVYCNEKCYTAHWPEGGKDLIEWYKKNRATYARQEEVDAIKASVNAAINM